MHIHSFDSDKVWALQYGELLSFKKVFALSQHSNL